MQKFIENAIGAFKYVLAVFMMYAGVTTAFGPLHPLSGQLGFLYSTRIWVVIFGIVFFFSGLTLLYGKLKRSRKWTGRGLFAIYTCFLFATVLNALTYHFNPGFWVANLVGTLITGALWLRWKFKTEYFNRRHFIDDWIATDHFNDL
jgi:hypothetical protein